MKKEQTNWGESTTYCKHCDKQIYTANYLLHQARCQHLKDSRIKFEPEPEKVQLNNNHIIKPSFKKQEKNSRQRISGLQSKEKRQEVERIPCTNCGYMQTFLELDTHPTTCSGQEIRCQYCNNSFPTALMEDHLQVCQIKRQQLGEEEPEEEQELHGRNINPFFNGFNSFGRNNFPEGFLSPRQSSRSSPFTQVFEYNNGPNHQRITFNSGNNRHRIDNNEEQHFRDLPQSFHQLLEMFVARRAIHSESESENGLTKDQIKKLPRTFYRKVEGAEDLCTICYCQFEEKEEVLTLRCKHLYHPECIIKWLEKNRLCPVCKQPSVDPPNNQQRLHSPSQRNNARQGHPFFSFFQR